MPRRKCQDALSLVRRCFLSICGGQRQEMSKPVLIATLLAPTILLLRLGTVLLTQQRGEQGSESRITVAKTTTPLLAPAWHCSPSVPPLSPSSDPALYTMYYYC